MKRNGKLSVAIHVLAHLAASAPAPMTSEDLAGCLRTNAVVIRRSLAGLREAGIVASSKGHGGGWTLARPATSITLRDVYALIAEPRELAPRLEIGTAGCHIAATVDRALSGFYDEAELMFLDRLHTVSLADLATGFAHRPAQPAVSTAT